MHTYMEKAAKWITYKYLFTLDFSKHIVAKATSSGLWVFMWTFYILIVNQARIQYLLICFVDCIPYTWTVFIYERTEGPTKMSL